MDKAKLLEKIGREIEECQRCRKDSLGRAVVGEGNANADVVFIGEAPGKEEAKTGRPFVGRSGQLLRQLIRGIGLREEGVFITSPVKYLPKRGTPNKTQIEHGRSHLDKQLAVIEPEILVLLGSVACQGVLGQKLAILSEHGRVVEKDGRKHLITLHPAAAIRFPKYKKLLLKDFQKLKNLIEK
ncbi:hypothetical protein A3A66_00110 [Microgenomates group bacterium RIFCSPLOWO2_01_FULL_46_13]|nr:MAG: hypothetical protein A2783_03390 [Microgenomates group bacterium RIFCSPHIGHO2_01_FULL_45_11]OGV94423.1 MAG: hypothetical protein A3A66_00110 [Microgenomates group bacterium RIFCSPLOWO2_01_FULL_46_13]